MKTILHAVGLTALIATATTGFATPSDAASTFPTSIVGTWKGDINTATATIKIKSQLGTASCKTVAGTISAPGGGTDGIGGFYCPPTGRFVLKRSSGTSTSTFQIYSGSLAQTDSSLVGFMGGTFREYYESGATGPYTFALYK